LSWIKIKATWNIQKEKYLKEKYLELGGILPPTLILFAVYLTKHYIILNSNLLYICYIQWYLCRFIFPCIFNSFCTLYSSDSLFILFLVSFWFPLDFIPCILLIPCSFYSLYPSDSLLILFPVSFWFPVHFFPCFFFWFPVHFIPCILLIPCSFYSLFFLISC